MKEPNPVYGWALRTSPPLRWIAGVLLIAGGFLGFLPVLGFWMIPLGVLLLASGVPRVRSFARDAIRCLRGWAAHVKGWRNRG